MNTIPSENSGLMSAAMSALQQAGFRDTEFHRSNLSVRELPYASLVRIHSLQAEALTLPGDMAGALAAIELPRMVGQTSGHDPVAMCLRPGEWLVCSEALSTDELLTRSGSIVPTSQAADRTAILDVSDGLAGFRLAGAAAPWLLAKLSSLDFVGGKNAGPHCARTRLGQVAAVIHYRPSAGGTADFVYDVIIDRSIARYVWELLQHSADHAEELLAAAGFTPTAT